MNKGDIIELEITDISEEGSGIGKLKGLVVFVKNALLGEIVKARLDKIKKNYALATCIEVIKKSEHEIVPICPHEECGGCLHRRLNYETQLKLKQSQVMEKLYRLGGIPKELSFDIIGMDNPYHYRNKAQMPVSTGGIVTKKGGIILPACDPIVGFYKMGTHDVVNCKACRIQPPIVMEIASVLEGFMKSDKLTAYDEKWDKGLFRHLIVKIAEATGEIMVIFVINGKGIPNAEKLIRQLDDAVNAFSCKLTNKTYSLESVYTNTLKGKSNKNMGDANNLLAGKPTILEKLEDLYFEISPSAFYQVNPEQTVKLYNKVLEFADLKASDKILDLYCGVGSIGICCAKHMKNLAKNSEISGQVVGVEIVKEAVVDANRNAVINDLVNARFICGKAEEELECLPFAPNIVILDPPRSGCKPSLFQDLEKIGAEKIIYVSCEPATLARDMATLISMGYKVENGAIVDMFPHTGRIEVITLLSKLDSKKYISVELPMDDMDLTSAESKATYKKIQNYVLEKFGVRVSTLYIAQVKRKYGLEVREHYNISKNENQKVLQCPIEKEKAILDALKYFKMIKDGF